VHGDVAFRAQTPEGDLHCLRRHIELTAKDIDGRKRIPIFVIPGVEAYKKVFVY